MDYFYLSPVDLELAKKDSVCFIFEWLRGDRRLPEISDSLGVVLSEHGYFLEGVLKGELNQGNFLNGDDGFADNVRAGIFGLVEGGPGQVKHNMTAAYYQCADSKPKLKEALMRIGASAYQAQEILRAPYRLVRHIRG